MERMWRKVNHSFGGRNSKSTATLQSTDTVSSAGGFGDGQIVVAVQEALPNSGSNSNTNNNNNMPSSTITGRRLAASGEQSLNANVGCPKSLSQLVLHNSTASSERRRRRRRKSRARRSGVSCVGGGGGDNMSSSGGFYTIKEAAGTMGTSGSNHRHRRSSQSNSTATTTNRMFASSAPSGTVMMYPNVSREATTNNTANNAANTITATATTTTQHAHGKIAPPVVAATTTDVSLRQRAVAKLRMFNFHLNWDLHMTHCKPCGPRLSGGGGGSNIIMRRLCRNRRHEDNELYRSNSFKFERFERKECADELSNTMKKQIAICDDYSLPVDFVKKRPSSFDPNLAEAIPTNLENWTAPSPQTEFIAFVDSTQSNPQLQQQQVNAQREQLLQGAAPPPPPPPAPPSLSTLPSNNATAGVCAPLPPPLPPLAGAIGAPNNTLPNQPLTHPALQSFQPHSIQLKAHNQRNNPQQQQQQQQLRPIAQHPPLPTASSSIKQASIKLIEGYSDPSDSKAHKKVYHKKGKRRANNKSQHQQNQQHHQQQQQQQKHQTEQQKQQKQSNKHKSPNKDKRSNYSSDSSAPKSSDDEDNHSIKVPELNSPDSISDDLVRPLPPQLYRSPRKLGVTAPSETSKRNPSPYYYSDILKSKDSNNSNSAADKEAKNKSRQSTASEPPQLTQPPVNVALYRKSTSLDVPERIEHDDNVADNDEEEDDFEETEPTVNTAVNLVPGPNDTPKRYSFTEDGVHIIRCDSPSTSTSEESDCSECQKRREWHAKALALVRKTCNVQPLNFGAAPPASVDCAGESILDTDQLKCTSFIEDTSPSMPPHRLFGPAVCACVAPTIGDDIDEYFRPRSIFYVHPHGVHECADCIPSGKQLAAVSGFAQSDNALTEADDDEMSGRTRQIYETAFDCKIAKSDDDLDEVDRITNHSVLLQLNNGNNLPLKPETRSPKSGHSKSRLEGKRLKNSKNHAIQEQSSNSGGNASGSGSPLTVNATDPANPSRNAESSNATAMGNLTAEMAKMHIRGPPTSGVDQQNNTTTSTSSSQLPMRGYTPSPPSTAPLPIKFPRKHDRFFMNSIKSAPNLPSSNPAHPRLRDLRLPLQSSLRQQQQPGGGSSLGTSNENSINDSAYANPPSSTTHHAHHGPSSGGARMRDRPRSFVLESGRVLELRRSHASHHHHVGNGGGRRTHNYSSTESIATSSSGGSMESLRSSTSEGNRSTSSSESRHSTSLSSHSSESGSSSVAFPLRAPVVIHSKLHILSPISDKSSQEPASEQSEQNKTRNASPEEAAAAAAAHQQQQQGEQMLNPQMEALKKKRPPANKTLLQLADEIIGSDSGISLHSREDSKLATGLQKFTLPKLNFPPSDKANDSSNSALAVAGGSSGAMPQDLRDLPFDMPKLRRRKTLQQEACTSGSATSVDLGDLPFDMPKLRRRLRANQAELNNLIVHSTESSGISQASSSHSMRDENKPALKLDAAMFRQNLTLNLNEPRQVNKFSSLDLHGLAATKELNLNVPQGYTSAVDLIDVSIPLERQGWYHGAITRIDAESTLRPLSEGSFLVRNCESTKQDYSLSLKGAKGFMHMRIQRNEAGQYILGQFSRPFETVPDMIRHFCLNRLPVRGAEHMCLIEPVIAQLL